MDVGGLELLFEKGGTVTTFRETQMMKLVLTLFICIFAASISAQTLTFQDGSLYITKRGKTETLAQVIVYGNDGKVETVEVAPIKGAFNPGTLQLVSSFLRSELKLADNTPITYGYADTRADGAHIMVIESGRQESPRSHSLGYGKPALWRAGQHKLNALGWGAGGAAFSVIVSLIASPAAGLVIGGFSGVMAIVQSVKSAKAMQEAAGDYEAQVNQKEPAN